MVVVVAGVEGGVFELAGGGAEPVDLVLFDPVVAAELALVGRVGVGVEQVEGYGGVGAAVTAEDFDDVVAGAVDFGGAGGGEREGEVLGELHEGWAGEGAFVVVVAEDEGVGCFVGGAERGDFEEGALGVGGGFAVDEVAGEDD